MTNISADYLFERRRLNRKVTVWRIVAALAIIIAIGVAGARGAKYFSAATPHIAKLKLTGLITGDEDTLRRLQGLESSKAAAVILEINSPGGTTVGSEEIYEAIRRLDGKKPVVAVVDGMAASGAYIAAIGSERIFAHGNSIVGSIGVLVQFPNFSGLMDKLGVKYESIKSSPLKAAPNGFEPTSDAARDAIASLVSDSYAWFKDLVRDRRGMNDEELAKVDDGRIFDGRQGLPLKLIDALGGEPEAVAWLEKEKGVAKGLPVRDVSEPPQLGGFRLFSQAAAALGLASVADLLKQGAESGLVSVDGLLSVWQL